MELEEYELSWIGVDLPRRHSKDPLAALRVGYRVRVAYFLSPKSYRLKWFAGRVTRVMARGRCDEGGDYVTADIEFDNGERETGFNLFACVHGLRVEAGWR